MKFKYLLIICLTLIFAGCSDDDNVRDNNPCLVEKSVNVTYNLSFPLFAAILDAGPDGEFFLDDREFIRGVYIRIISGQAFAYELAEPNDCAGQCSVPELKDGFFIYDCGNTTTRYDFVGTKIDGEEGDFNMRQYNTRIENNQLTITY